MNQRLENEKVSSLLFSLALPSILAQLATLIYNMVDLGHHSDVRLLFTDRKGITEPDPSGRFSDWISE